MLKTKETPLEQFDRMHSKRKPPKQLKNGDPVPSGFIEISNFIWEYIWKQQMMSRGKGLLLLAFFTIAKNLSNKNQPTLDEKQYIENIKIQYILKLREKEKQGKSSKIFIPKNFDIFILSKEFLQLIHSVREYAEDLNKIEKKYEILQEESKDRPNSKPQLLASEINRISKKAQIITEAYSKILLNKGAESFQKSDKYFFEAVIDLIGNVLQKYFDEKDFEKIEEEINRLFRTNIFNLKKRKHIQDNRIKQYPVLQDGQQGDKIENLIDRLQKRSKIPSQNIRAEYMKEKSEIRPMFVRNTPGQSLNSRSPLMALIIPSKNEAIYQFEKGYSMDLNQTVNQTLKEGRGEFIKKQFQNTFSNFNRPKSKGPFLEQKEILEEQEKRPQTTPLSNLNYNQMNRIKSRQSKNRDRSKVQSVNSEQIYHYLKDRFINKSFIYQNQQKFASNNNTVNIQNEPNLDISLDSNMINLNQFQTRNPRYYNKNSMYYMNVDKL